jgi:hypothetical protein
VTLRRLAHAGFHRSATAPSAPQTGQIWEDTSTSPSTLKVYTGSAWEIPTTGATLSGAAGGHLTGTYPSPSIANTVITDAHVVAANKDGTAGTPSLRTLGTGSQQAKAGTALDGHVIRDEGTGMTQRAALNFVGAGVQLTDDSVNGETEVTITGAAAGPASETAQGLVEEATTAEVQAGTSGVLYVPASKLKAELDRRLTPEAWQTPTLTNSWVNFGAPYESAGYYKDPLGTVWVRGTIKNGSLNAAVFTLPTGYRPANDLPFAVVRGGDVYARVVVRSTGVLEVTHAAAVGEISLNGISFRV